MLPCGLAHAIRGIIDGRVKSAGATPPLAYFWDSEGARPSAMSVWCNACGRLSQDHEFCDHCNADLGPTGGNLPPERCPFPTGDVPLSLEQRHGLAFPEAS